MKRIIFITVLCAFVAVPAFADLTPIGDLLVGESWGQRFYENVGTFDLMAVRMVYGSPFESPAFRHFSDTSWGMMYENNPGPGNPVTMASAGGNPTNYLEYDWLWCEPPVPMAFDYVVFSGENILLAQRILGPSWDCSTWYFQGPTLKNAFWLPTRNEVLGIVPAPAAVLLGMLGLSVAGLKLRKSA